MTSIANNRVELASISVDRKFVVKPSRGAGSNHVYSIETDSDLNMCVSTIDENAFPVLIQNFFEGEEVCVECLSDSGIHHFLGITGKVNNADSASSILYTKLDVTAAERERIYRFIAAMLDSMSVENGCTHTEVIISDSGDIGFVESHMRPPGSRIYEMWEKFYGIDLHELVARQYVGLFKAEEDLQAIVQHPPVEYLGVGVSYGDLSEVGTRTIDYIAIEHGHSGEDVKFLKQRGDVIRRGGGNNNALVSAIFRATDINAVIAEAHLFMECVKVEYQS